MKHFQRWFEKHPAQSQKNSNKQGNLIKCNLLQSHKFALIW